MEFARVLLALVPVLGFLFALHLMDTFRLITPRSMTVTILAGGVTALAGWGANTWLMETFDLPYTTVIQVVAPFLEETLKALVIVALFRAHKIGFLVDAAIRGFAVGTGFALVENIYYLTAVDSTSLSLWLLRGFGAAIMHGSTTALFAIITKTLLDRRQGSILVASLPGFLAALLIHGVYNRLSISPTVTTIAILCAMPAVLAMVFAKGESVTRKWLGAGFDTDQELFHQIESGEIDESRVGRYLTSMQEIFPGPVVADMFCMLQLHVELSMRAKGILLAHQAGFELPIDSGTEERFIELAYLRKSIGKAGFAALSPLLHQSSRDAWQLHMLRRRNA